MSTALVVEGFLVVHRLSVQRHVASGAIKVVIWMGQNVGRFCRLPTLRRKRTT